MVQDLHELPKLRDGLTYLYLEWAIVHQNSLAIEAMTHAGRMMIPAAALSVLMLGPGISISHAAVKTLADNGCSIVWVGEEGTRMYASGMGETRKSHHLLRQAELVSCPDFRLEVVRRMYTKRFSEEVEAGMTIEQLRGKEGARVRGIYASASAKFGVPWSGRKYNRNDWSKSDAINRSLSAANALLNGLCHAAIVSGGYSPGLGFIHTGKQLSFVYDIADLYKAELTIPCAFQVVSESSEKVESRTREACRKAFREAKLLQRILPDIDELLVMPKEPVGTGDVDKDSALPGPLWSPEQE